MTASVRYMARFLACVPAAFLCLSGAAALSAQPGAPAIESRIPGGAEVFLRAVDAAVLARALSSYRDRIATEVDDPLAKWMAGFAAKTGIDLTDVPSLKKAGVDTTKPLGLSRYAGNGRNEYLALLPVTTGRNFPYTFTKLLQRFGDGKTDLHPAITRYGRHATFQILRDIFFAVDGDYFFLSSSGPLLRKALDLGAAQPPKESLAADASYLDCASKLGSTGRISLYSREGIPWNNGAPDTAGREPGKRAGIIYSGATLDLGADSLGGRLVYSLDPASADSSALLAAVKTGAPAQCPHLEAMTFYIYLALDLRSLAGRCPGSEGDSSACGIVNRGLDLFERYFGLNFSRELLPRAGRAVSFLVRKAAVKGSPDDFLLHVSKDESITARDMRRSLFREVERRGGTVKEEKIGTIDSLQATDDRGRKTIYAVDDRGIFIGNSPDLTAACLGTSAKSFSEICGLAPGTPGPAGAFAHARLNLREESVIRTMALLGLYGTRRRLYNFITAADTITLTGSVAGSAVIFDAHVKLLPAQKNNGRYHQ